MLKTFIKVKNSTKTIKIISWRSLKNDSTRATTNLILNNTESNVSHARFLSFSKIITEINYKNKAHSAPLY